MAATDIFSPSHLLPLFVLYLFRVLVPCSRVSVVSQEGLWAYPYPRMCPVSRLLLPSWARFWREISPCEKDLTPPLTRCARTSRDPIGERVHRHNGVPALQWTSSYVS